MPRDRGYAVTLTCHPDTPTDAVRSIDAHVCREPGGKLAVTYILEGDLDRLRVPAPRAPRFADGLWRHTCCEIFIGSKGSPAYYELNLSPSCEWAAYAFDGYRSPRVGESQAAGLVPQVAVRISAGGLELDAVIRLDRLPALYRDGRLLLALAVVIEQSDGMLSYWALRHPSGKPDFHHPQAFALDLGESDE